MNLLFVAIKANFFIPTCFPGAPRLLQAIAADGIVPFLRPFAVTSKKGEPIRALLLTAGIAEAGVLLANVDYIAPIITMLVPICSYCSNRIVLYNVCNNNIVYIVILIE